MPLTNDHTPAPPPEVTAVLDQLLSRVKAILQERFVALYLYGSLASGGFDPRRSDIDFVVVTTDRLPRGVVSQLERMHQDLAASGSKWAAKLEGAYIPAAALRRHDPAHPPRPTVNEGRFCMDREASDWVIQRRVMREHGAVMEGPAPEMLIDPVSPQEIRQAVLGILAEWWAPMLQDAAFLTRVEYQAFAVLTMCRALHTLEHAEIGTKTQAARWALKSLAPRWQGLIRAALAWPEGDQRDRLEETLDFIRYTLERSRRAHEVITGERRALHAPAPIQSKETP